MIEKRKEKNGRKDMNKDNIERKKTIRFGDRRTCNLYSIVIPEKREKERRKLRKDLKERMKDKCVKCGYETLYDIETHIDERQYYVEGGGQLCERCYKDIYGI